MVASPLHTPIPGGAAAEKRAARSHAHMPAAPVANAAAGVAGVGAIRQEHSATADALDHVSSAVNAPVMFAIFGSMLAMPIGFISRMLPARAQSWVTGLLSAPAAMIDTRLGELGNLRSNAAKAFAENASSRGDHVLAGSAHRVAERWGAQDTGALARAVGDRAARMEAFADASAVAMPIHMGDGVVSRFAQWRVGRIEKAVQNIHSPKEAGFFGKIAKAIPFLGEGSLEGAAKTAHLEHLGVVQKHWSEVASGGASALLKGLPAMLGRVKLSHALFSAGLVAGIGATLLRTHAQNATIDNTIRAFAGDLLGVDPQSVTQDMLTGANAPPLLKKIVADGKAEQRGANVSSGAQAVVDGSMVLMSEMSMPLAIATSAGSTAVSGLFSHESQALQAYGVLKAEAAGQGTLTTKDKMQCVKILVGLAPEALGAAGGIAQKMVEEKLTPAQMLREIADPAKMTARAAAAKQAAAEALQAEQAKAAQKPAPMIENKTVSAVKHEGMTVTPQGRGVV